MSWLRKQLTNRVSVSSVLVVLIAFGTLTISGSQFVPQKKTAESPSPLSRFRRLTPAQRIVLVNTVDKFNNLLRPVKRGSIRNEITERGNLQMEGVSDIVCRLKGRDKLGSTESVIKWVVEEGTYVKRGQKVVELDDSALMIDLQQQEFLVDKAQAEFIRAKENVPMTILEAENRKRLAEIDLEIAKITLKKYKGNDPLEKQLLTLKVERAAITRKLLLPKLKVQTVAAEVAAKSAESKLKWEKTKLRDVEDELAKCKLVAPQDGTVYYYDANTARRRVGANAIIAQGEPVTEGQKLIQIWDGKEMSVRIQIHETVVRRLKVGDKATVRIDALPDQKVFAIVKRIGRIPTKIFTLNVNVYPVELRLNDVPECLRPGMSAEVNILGKVKKDVLRIPLYATHGASPYSRKRTCFVKSANGLQERNIDVELGDANFAEVKSGLKEGDVVLTVPPAVLYSRATRSSGGAR